MLLDTLRQRSHRGDRRRRRRRSGPCVEAVGRLAAARHCEAVETLVQQERKALAALDSFDGADEHLQSTLQLHPEDVLSQVLTHFEALRSQGTGGRATKDE